MMRFGGWLSGVLAGGRISRSLNAGTRDRRHSLLR